MRKRAPSTPLIDSYRKRGGEAADERGYGDHDQAVADDLGVLAEPARLTDEDEIGHGQADGVGDPVPVDRQGTDLDGDRIGGEVDLGGGGGSLPCRLRGGPPRGGGGRGGRAAGRGQVDRREARRR